MTLDIKKILSLLFIPIYLSLIVILLILNISTSFNPPILLLVFNSLFLGLIPLYVAYIAYKSFRESGSTGVLLKGTGMLMLGLGAIAAGAVNYLPNSMNANVTAQNTGFCISAFLQLVGILIVLSGTVPRQRPGDTSKIAILYGGVVLVFFLFVLAAVLGSAPPFFIQGVGFTALREFVITSAIEFFALAAGILLYLYFRKQEEFFFWYSIGMALIGIGLLAVHFPSVLGSPLGWVGRSAQYLGGVYVLVAFISLKRSAHQTGIPITEMLSRFFSESEANYKSLVETATDAIVVHDSTHRIIVWNRAAEEMFGYSQSEVLGSSFIHLVIPDEFTDNIKNKLKEPAISGTSLREHKPIEISVRRKDGSTFPVELSLSRHLISGSWVNTCIIRDLTLRKKAEETLKENEARFRGILENVQDGFIRTDKEGVIRMASPSAARMYGYDSPGEMAGHPAVQLYKNLGDRNFILDELTKRKKVMDFESTAIRKDGSFFPVSLNVQFHYDNQGQIQGTEAFVRDITERKLAEENLREAHRRTTAILEGIADTFYSLDNQWRFSIVNPAAEKAPFGRPAHELLGRVIWELYPDLVGTRIHQHYLDAAEKHTLEHYEAQSPLNRHWYEVFMQGQDSGVDVYMRDITERKRAEEALQNNIRLLEDVMEGSTSPIFLKDLEGKFISINSALERMLGMSRQELKGKTDYDIAPKGLADYWRSHDKKVIGTRKAIQIEETANFQDRHYIFLSNKFPLVDTYGQIYGVGAISHDITDRKKAEEELTQKNEDLQAAYEEVASTQEELRQNVEELSLRERELVKSEANLKDALAEKEILLSEIHHRVKNNLTAFISLLSLDGSYENTEGGRALRKDLQNRARSMALIHETLYRTGKFSNVDMETYLTTLLSQIAGTFAENTKIRAIINVHDVALDLARATTAGLIINELVTNSFMYAFPPGFDCMAVRGEPCAIRISLTSGDGIYVLTVADNGRGLPEGFDPLTTKSLGLKLVNFLARHQLRAEIRVRSEKGTEFIFRMKKTEEYA